MDIHSSDPLETYCEYPSLNVQRYLWKPLYEWLKYRIKRQNIFYEPERPLYAPYRLLLISNGGMGEAEGDVWRKETGGK